MANNNIELSVIFPAYNEGARIKHTLQETRKVLRRAGLNFEMIVVDDGSVDQTSRLTAQMARTASYKGILQLVSYSPNQGKGWALKQGVRAARGKYVAFLDADLDISPDHLSDYLQRLKDAAADAVVGSKRHPQSDLEYSRGRVWISNLYYWVNRFLFRLPVKDTQSGVKLFRREVLLDVMPKMLVKQFAFDLEMLVNIRKNGGKIIEAPVRISDHFHFGRIRFKALWQAFIDTMGIFFRSRITGFYKWHFLPLVKYRKTPITVLLATAGYSEMLEESVDALRDSSYSDLRIIVLTAKGGFRFPGVKVVETGAVSLEEQYLQGVRLVKSGVVGLLQEEHRLLPGHLDRVAGYLAHRELDGVWGPVYLAGGSAATPFTGGVAKTAALLGGCGYRYRQFRQRKVRRALAAGLFCRAGVLRDAVLAGEGDGNKPAFSCGRVIAPDNTLLYTPDLRLTSLMQDGIRGSLLRLWSLARESGFLAAHRPRMYFRFTHLLPSLFGVALLVGAFFAGLSPYFRPVYGWIIGGYAVLLFLLTGYWIQWVYGLGIALLLAVSQFIYGAGFLVGLFSGRRSGGG